MFSYSDRAQKVPLFQALRSPISKHQFRRPNFVILFQVIQAIVSRSFFELQSSSLHQNIQETEPRLSVQFVLSFELAFPLQSSSESAPFSSFEIANILERRRRFEEILPEKVEPNQKFVSRPSEGLASPFFDLLKALDGP